MVWQTQILVHEAQEIQWPKKPALLMGIAEYQKAPQKSAMAIATAIKQRPSAASQRASSAADYSLPRRQNEKAPRDCTRLSRFASVLS